MNDGLTGMGLLLAGGLFFPSVYNTSKYVLTNYFRHKLNLGDIYLICEKCTSGTQALMSFAVGLIIVSQVKDIMVDTHWLTNAYAWFGLPYFLHDVWAMYMTFTHNGGHKSTQLPPKDQALGLFVRNCPLLIVHHLIMPAIVFPIIIFYRHNLGDFFVGIFYLIELTIPFISIRSILAQLELKHSPFYVVSGLLMLLSFFCVRILVFPYLYWHYAIHAGLRMMDVPKKIPLKCNLGCLMLFAPQVYWFWLMLRGSVRFFYKSFIHWQRKPHGR